MLLLLSQWAPSAHAFSGTEGASFLELPVGARPAAMGSAYSSLASDAYAPTINPGGLGFVTSNQIAGMHLVYLQDTSSEYLSFVHPLTPGHSLGAAIQYFRPGNLTGTGPANEPLGSIDGYYAAYALAYGQKITDILSLGVAGKLISAKIDNVSATSWAGDGGLMLAPTPEWRVALTGSNLGGAHLKFLQEGDALPVLYRLGTSYAFKHGITAAVEGVHRQSGLDSAAVGFEWMNPKGFSFRGGYDTERLRGLSPIAGMTVGLGMNLWGEELSYAWQPVSDLGSSHFISLLLRFGEERREAINRSDDTSHINLESPEFDETGSMEQELESIK